MTIELHELLSHRVLYYRFAGSITLGELNAVEAVEASLFAAQPAETCVHIIADLTGIETIAAPLFPKLQQLRFASGPQVCRVVVAGANPYLRALAISLGIINTRHEFVFRPTLDEARHLIANHTGIALDDLAIPSQEI